MTLPEDFKEFIALLNAHQVNYLIVGGYAVGFHSRPRFTQDIDFWIEARPDNARRISSFLKDFGFGELNLGLSDLPHPDRIIQLGYAPLWIDIITDLSGVDFKSGISGGCKEII